MKKIVNALVNVFAFMAVLAAVMLILYTIVSVTDSNKDDRTLVGYRAFIVLSDSMSKTDFSAGDLVVVKKVNPDILKEGDIISYISTNSENYGQTVTHKIRKLTTDSEGNPGFVTYGTTTDTDDESIVTYSNVLGKYQFHLASVGRFFMFLKSKDGYVLFIFLPLMLLTLYTSFKSTQIFKEYKKEQLKELQAEKEQVEAERGENDKMMEEIRKLQAELEELMRNNSDNK